MKRPYTDTMDACFMNTQNIQFPKAFIYEFYKDK